MAEPTLKFLHSEGTLNRGKLELFRRFSSEELKASLAPGQQGSLKVRLDGTRSGWPSRLTVLVERGEDIHALPREIIKRES